MNECCESRTSNQNSPLLCPQHSIFPSFHYSIGIKLHPSGVNSKPGPQGPDSLLYHPHLHPPPSSWSLPTSGTAGYRGWWHWQGNESSSFVPRLPARSLLTLLRPGEGAPSLFSSALCAVEPGAPPAAEAEVARASRQSLQKRPHCLA